MALDVYVGSLTRYFAGDWECIGDRASGRRGRAIATDEMRVAAAPAKDRERIRASVLAWRRRLGAALAPYLAEPLAWNETAEAPWFTGRPGWRDFGALVLWAAYAEQPALRRPAALPKAWDEDAALIRSNAEGFRSRYSHLVRNVELWLPAPLDFTFESEDVDGRRIIVGSSTTLRRQLGELNAATWKMDEDEMAALARERSGGGASLEAAARRSMAVMIVLARQAVRHGLPVKLDY